MFSLGSRWGEGSKIKRGKRRKQVTKRSSGFHTLGKKTGGSITLQKIQFGIL